MLLLSDEVDREQVDANEVEPDEEEAGASTIFKVPTAFSRELLSNTF